MIYFGVVMATLMHKGHGKFYVSVIVRMWKKYKFQDNFVSYHPKEEGKISNGKEEKVKKEEEHHEHRIVHPVRDAIRGLLENCLDKIIVFQEKEDKKE